MQDPSHDRTQPNERTEAPAFPEPGASMFVPPAPSGDLPQLVHDLANWYQRLEAHLERLERVESVPADRLQGLRDGLRRCAELGAAALGADVAPARLPQVLEEFVAEDQALRLDARCQLRLECLDQQAHPQVELGISAIALENILLNLVRNARRACTNDRPVELRWQVQGAKALVQVLDHGDGMDEATLARCLETGFTTKERQGHGLGLSGVRREVEAAGGRVELHSTVGRGTEVALQLPLRGEESTVERVSDGNADLPQRILVVDDDAEVCELLQAFVESFDARARVAADGGATRRALAEEDFDAVVLDQGLPDASGLELAEELRQRYPNLVLVLLTGDPAIRKPALAGGVVDGVGVKPLNRAQVRALLEDATEHAATRSDEPKQRPAEA